MPDRLIAPSVSDHRSTLADWMELMAFLSRRSLASVGDLRGALEIEDDNAGAASSDEIDERIEERVQEVFQDLQDRLKAAGPTYPFVIDHDGNEIRLQSGSLTLSNYVYLFCLLVSVYRHDFLLPQSIFKDLAKNVPKLFQACGTLAAAGFVAGHAISFDFPRPSGTGFVAALRKAYRRIGEGETRDKAPAGASRKVKDARIDVIAWRPCPDGYPGQLYLLGQSASGKGWRGKSVTSAINNFYNDWFTRPPASPIVTAIFIPFSADDDVTPYSGRSYAQERHGRFLSLTYGLGIVFDRCRIPFFAQQALDASRRSRGSLDRIEEGPRIKEWVQAVRKRALGLTV